ncbi:MAG: DUF1206 domain-containing protein [Chloroflexaceae bacterium]|nr:DUF1206 domain-containing protein [Chloroflexaceae bacterium]NJO07722.1 DUF1206 domain-containing protein [Chloroflexaceae bacterium]
MASERNAVQQHSDKVDPRKNQQPVEIAARLGYTVKGIIYGLIGVLALQTALGTGGSTTGTSGALQNIASQPFGSILLGIVGVGLLGYALWRFVEAAIDPDNEGSDAKGIIKRLGYVGSGIIYGFLAFSAFQILMGSGGGGGDSTQTWTAWLMSQPFGQWLVGIAGLISIGIGLYRIYEGFAKKFKEKLNTAEMSQREETWATRISQFGLAAHGVVLGLIGVFLLQAAWQAQPEEARGLGQVLQELAEQPYGPWLLGIVAAGLVAYGIYSMVMGRYRRLNIEQ